MNNKKDNMGIIILIVVVAVVISVILSWFCFGNVYEGEKDKLISKYKTEIEDLTDNYETEMETLKNSHINETQQLTNEKENALDQLTNISNNFSLYKIETGDFVRCMKEGFNDLANSNIYGGYAAVYYDEANDYRDLDLFYSASLYAGYADACYGSASGFCELAEGHFEQAVNNTPSEHLKNLASLYADYADYGSQINSEMHQACEYFSSACNCYYQGYYETGDSEIEEMNEHIEEHDRLVPLFNDVLADIEAWW